MALARTLRMCCLAAGAAAQCALHPNCAGCVADGGCGWCAGDIGGGNPGRCVANASACDTVFERTSCPDCRKPWIRFASGVPSQHAIDCVITQGNLSRSWTGYRFAQFSDWSQDFDVGHGTIALSSGGRQLVSVDRLLTPGPLVVMVKESVAAPGT
eukprot:gene10521-1438_t